jgi:hypothetical protein
MNQYTARDVQSLFPDLVKIQDADLRAKVAQVWLEALRVGCGGRGWTLDELRQVKFTLLAGDIDMMFIEHLNSCVKQCLAICDILRSVFGDKIPIDRDALAAGALLADVGKLLEFDKDASGQVIKGSFGEALRHPFTGVALCYKHDIPAEVMHIVATHSFEGDPPKVQRSIESIIFHHADFIDFDIAKCLGAKSASKKRQ